MKNEKEVMKRFFDSFSKNFIGFSKKFTHGDAKVSGKTEVWWEPNNQFLAVVPLMIDVADEYGDVYGEVEGELSFYVIPYKDKVRISVSYMYDGDEVKTNKGKKEIYVDVGIDEYDWNKLSKKLTKMKHDLGELKKFVGE